MKARYELDTVSVLFSGGTDSTLAAVLMLERARRVELLTFDPGYVFFLENTRVHARALADRFGPDRVEQRFLDLRPFTGNLLWNDPVSDLRRFGFSMASLVCLGCRLSMHARAIAHNLEQGIPYLADGSIRVQSDTPEQMESTLESNRAEYLETYGIEHISPLYEERHSDRVLLDMGLSEFPNLKKQYILYDTQGTCIFGVPADVYARIFYRPRLMGDRRERESGAYRDLKYPLLHRAVQEYLESRGQSVERLVANLRATAERDRTAREATT